MTLLCTAVETAISEVHKLVRTGGVPTSGKIQGDGRKFLYRFKSYSGSQISSQSLNEFHVYQLQPKSTTKGEFFSYIFVFDCFESASRIGNGERSRSAVR